MDEILSKLSQYPDELGILVLLMLVLLLWFLVPERFFLSKDIETEEPPTDSKILGLYVENPHTGGWEKRPPDKKTK